MRNFRVLERLDHVVTVHDVSEDIVAAVKPIGRVKGDIELRVARIRPAVGVSDGTASTMRQDVAMFVGDRQSRSADAVPIRRAALEHKAGHDTVKTQTFVIVARHKFEEVTRRIRRLALRLEELNHDFTKRGDRAVRRRLNYRHRDLRSLRKRRGQTVDGTRVDKIKILSLNSVVPSVIRRRKRNDVGKRFIKRGVEHLSGFKSFKNSLTA